MKQGTSLLHPQVGELVGEHELDGSEKVVMGNLAQLRSGMVLPVTGQ